MKTIAKQNTILNMKRLLLILLVSNIFMSCSSDDDNSTTVNNTPADPCENAFIMGLNTANPDTGMTTLFSNTNFGSEIETATQLGSKVQLSNSSTYNSDLERYHYFSTANNEFINIIDTSPATISPLIGAVPNSMYGSIVYVKGTASYYILEFAATLEIKLAKVNPMTGVLEAPSVESGYTATSLNDIDSISITSNDDDEVYIGINQVLIKMDVSTSTPTALALLDLESATDDYLFHGFEYNNETHNINAIRTNASTEAHLVSIATDGTYTTTFDVSSDLYIPSILDRKYSTTLSCDNNHYIISLLDGTHNTLIHDIDQTTGEITTTDIENTYYFGLESNMNN